jgi:hypothetical protein
MSDAKTLTQFHGNDVWRDENGMIWLTHKDFTDVVDALAQTTTEVKNAIMVLHSPAPEASRHRHLRCRECDHHWPCKTYTAVDPEGAAHV